MMPGASSVPRAPIRRLFGGKEDAGVAGAHDQEIDAAPIEKARQTGAAALRIRLQGVLQDGTVPSSHITSIIGTPYSKPKGAQRPSEGDYRRGSRGCSTMKAHPVLSLGFLSAFLMI
jgi:hypothetical protein